MKSFLALMSRTRSSWRGIYAPLLLAPLLMFQPPAYAQNDSQIETDVQPPPVQPEQPAVQPVAPPASPLQLDQLRPEPIAEITDIQLIEIEDGLKVVLITDRPEQIEVFQSQEGSTLVVDITNATLSLADGGQYQQLNPTPGVASLTVEQRGSEIQLTVISSDETPPVAYFERLIEALEFDVVTAVPSETDTEIDFGSNNLRIIVAAEPLSGYRVPTASIGTRTNADILEVPQGIQVVPEAVLEDQAAGSLGDTLRNVSGVSTGRSSTSLRAITPTIRGFESNNVLRNGLRDDTLRVGSGLTNVERIEILKGPASVLFGAGNLGGTINLVTEVPLSEPLYEFEILGGSNSFYGSSIDWTGPFNDEAGLLGYRLNMTYENQSSFRDFERSEFFFVAPSLQLANTERSSLVVDIEYLSSRVYGTATGLPAVPAIGIEGNTFAETVLAQGGISDEDLQRAGTLDIRTNPSEPDLSYTETNIARLGYRFEYDFNDRWTFRNEFLGSFQETPQDSVVGATGYAQVAGRPNFGLINRIYLNNISSRDVFTLNTNVVGDYNLLGIDQTLLLGAEFSREEIADTLVQRTFLGRFNNSDRFNIFEPNYSPTSFFDDSVAFNNRRPAGDSITRRQSLGLYGQLQFDLTDYLIVLLGGRFDMADQFFVDDSGRGDRSPINTYDTAFSPRAGVVLQPAENVSLYASYTESFVPTIGRDFDENVFIPEQGRQIEAGIKTSLFDDRLGLTLAYYNLRRANVVTQDPDRLGFQVQVGEQASTGVEFDLIGEILPGWNIIANYAYTDARISQDNVFEEGLALLNAPKNSANLWTSYEIQSGDLEGLGLGLGVSFVGDRNGDLRRPINVPAYTRTDASLFYRRDGFNAQINFQNLFDIRYFEGARDENRVIPGEPFSIVGRLSWEF